MDPVIIFLRVLVPLSIFRFPLWGGLASMFLDGIDWSVNLFHIQNIHVNYLPLDKALDLYTYIIEGIVVLRWKKILAKETAITLFLLRVFGNVSFLIFRYEPLLFFFPNIFENFFLFYYGVWTMLGKEPNLSGKTLFVSAVILAIPKIFQEYVMHVRFLTDWRYINFPSLNFTYDNIAGQLIIGSLLILTVYFLQITKKKAHS